MPLLLLHQQVQIVPRTTNDKTDVQLTVRNCKCVCVRSEQKYELPFVEEWEEGEKVQEKREERRERK